MRLTVARSFVLGVCSATLVIFVLLQSFSPKMAILSFSPQLVATAPSAKQANENKYFRESDANERIENLVASPREERRNEAPQWQITKCQNGGSARSFHWKSQVREDQAVMSTYYNKDGCNGTFLEIGALDGLFFSNTYAMEYAYGWRGILIEANYLAFVKLRENRPNARTVWSAACEHNKTELAFVGAGVTGGIRANEVQARSRKNFQYVPCRPFGDLIRLAGVKAIDALFLDVEGSETEVLKTIDWSVPVGVWVIEMKYPYFSAEQRQAHDSSVRKMLTDHGYVPSSLNITDFYIHSDGLKKTQHPNDEVFEHPNYRAFLKTTLA